MKFLSKYMILLWGGPEYLHLNPEKMKKTLDKENMEEGDKTALTGMIDEFQLGRRHHSDSGKLESTKPSDSSNCWTDARAAEPFLYRLENFPRIL